MILSRRFGKSSEGPDPVAQLSGYAWHALWFPLGLALRGMSNYFPTGPHEVAMRNVINTNGTVVFPKADGLWRAETMMAP
jgi:hypothetical protein